MTGRDTASGGQVVTMLDRSYLAIGMPTLLIWGARDRIVPAGDVPRLRPLPLPRRASGVPPDPAGSGRPAPARFVKLLDEFLESTQPAEYDPTRWREILRRGRPD